MNARQRIEKAAKAAGITGDIYKGNDICSHLGVVYGWFVRPFGQNAIYLGKSAKAAIETLGQMEDYRAELAEEVAS
jgi:hypothetical protein